MSRTLTPDSRIQIETKKSKQRTAHIGVDITHKADLIDRDLDSLRDYAIRVGEAFVLEFPPVLANLSGLPEEENNALNSFLRPKYLKAENFFGTNGYFKLMYRFFPATPGSIDKREFHLADKLELNRSGKC